LLIARTLRALRGRLQTGVLVAQSNSLIHSVAALDSRGDSGRCAAEGPDTVGGECRTGCLTSSSDRSYALLLGAGPEPLPLVPCSVASDRRVAAFACSWRRRSPMHFVPEGVATLRTRWYAKKVILMPGLRQIPRSTVKGTRPDSGAEVEHRPVHLVSQRVHIHCRLQSSFRCLDCAGILPRDVRHSGL